jgi:hypothetical protein
LAYRLIAAADDVELRFYTPAFTRAWTLDLGPAPAGLSLAPLALPATLAKQLYYVQVHARTGRQEAKSAVLRFLVLR